MAIDEAKAAAVKAKLQEREEHIRESWVRAMEARLVREELEKCQKAEGVNHYENCKWLSEKYLTMLKDSQVRHVSLYQSTGADEFPAPASQVKGYRRIEV
ncbi:hypothetical protein BDN71DRAFT_148855 [Pleurotus eryngii]|uniref:NADH-ubiquinone oxidoreductase 12 kDa subunit n=1 Tax=Pleurotus eryngii TaxID=5323 RepID=A0A9P5ZQE3_PLEER|nr:hypothetical protein BDN71DRAFT_148855 [Pleurotus eryngii]